MLDVSNWRENRRENRSVADNIGKELGDSLIELFDEAERHWDDFCDNLNLVRGCRSVSILAFVVASVQQSNAGKVDE